MGHVRDRMEAHLMLAGLSESTRAAYIGCATRFVKWWGLTPELMGECEVRWFLLDLLQERKVAVGTYLPYLAAIRYLFAALGRPEVTAGIPWPRMRRRRPDVMTPDEVRRVIESAKTPFWKAFFATGYAAGLRRMEVAALRSAHIDPQAGLIRVVEGKGGKDRLVKLDSLLLRVLRRHWREHDLPGPWLFPARDPRGGWKDRHVDLGTASRAFAEAVEAAKIGRRVTLHGLRHAFATHQLEAGVDLHTLQVLLGHENIETTTLYTQIRTDRIVATPSLLQKLWQ